MTDHSWAYSGPRSGLRTRCRHEHHDWRAFVDRQPAQLAVLHQRAEVTPMSLVIDTHPQLSGASESHEDGAWNGATLTMSHVTDHPFKQRSTVSAL
jgi:hypothetical protein